MNAPSTSDSWIGRTIGDRQRYRLEQRLGGGGMGDVFLAMDTLLGQQVALKLLKETLAVSEELRKRFEREVALCAALKNDHIIQVNDYGVTPEGHPFYVMEYLRGQSLGQLLRRDNRLSVERTVGIVTQICDGLRLAHAGVTLWRDGATASEHIKVVHRDLKPDNIFLVPTALGELVKILDFGIAKIRHIQAGYTENITSVFLGTFHYAAPEQLEVEKDLDERADIYSLGLILYEMLTGTDPFGLGLNVRNISGMSWAMAHASQPPQPLRIQPGCEQLSPELEMVVMQCLQKLPNERFTSADELNQALKAAVAVKHGASSTTISQLPTSPLQEVGNTTPQRLTPLPQEAPPLQEASNATAPRRLTPTPSPSQPPLVVTGPQGLDTPQTRVSPPQLTTADSSSKRLPPTPPPRRKSPLLLAGAGVAIVISVTGAAYAYLRWQPVDLDKIRSLRAEAKYVECTNKAKTVGEGSSLYKDAQGLLNQCQLEQAKKLAAGNSLADAVTVASTIPQDSPLYPEAQTLVEQWSNRVLTQATAQFQAGKLDSATAQAEAIPKKSSVHPKAQAAIVQWKKDWQVAETQFNAAQGALDEGQWQVAINESNKVPNIAFWKNKTKPVVQKAQSEIAKADAAAKAAQRNNPPSQVQPGVVAPAYNPPPAGVYNPPPAGVYNPPIVHQTSKPRPRPTPKPPIVYRSPKPSPRPTYAPPTPPSTGWEDEYDSQSGGI